LFGITQDDIQIAQADFFKPNSNLYDSLDDDSENEKIMQRKRSVSKEYQVVQEDILDSEDFSEDEDTETERVPIFKFNSPIQVIETVYQRCYRDMFLIFDLEAH
jgi:hypothetical protein